VRIPKIADRAGIRACMNAYFLTLLSLFAVDLFATIIPGPCFIAVAQTAVQRGRVSAVALVSGFVAANLVWCLAVVFGLTAVFVHFPWLYHMIKILGGIYLIYFGISLWRDSQKGVVQEMEPVSGSRGRAFLKGMGTNFANPKSALYFGSVFSVFVRPGMPSGICLIAVLIILVNTLLIYGGLGLALSTKSAQDVYLRVKRPMNRLAGMAMAGFGARLLLRD
jgi:threonine efflux protein